MNTYVYVLTVFFIGYFLLECVFERKYPNHINDQLDKEIEIVLDESHLVKDTPYSMGALKIIHRIFDVLMSMVFNSVGVMVTVSYFVVKSY